MACDLRTKLEGAVNIAWSFLQASGLTLKWVIDRHFTAYPEFPLLQDGMFNVDDFVAVLSDDDLLDFLEYITYETGYRDGIMVGKDIGFDMGYEAGEKEVRDCGGQTV